LLQPAASPLVSIIVPARNEEACLGACLASLVAQADVEREIIVVDDHSSDRTAEIARSFPEAKVVTADCLAKDWCGKQNALATGVRHSDARGEWLLFTDADTVHKPGSLARALREAQEHGAALLSYSPAQRTKTLWELAIMPVIFAELAAHYRPRDVSDPQLPAAAANGQYLLITREAYRAVGGHAAVRASLLEDVELARLVKRSGRRLWFRFGGDAVETRMYRSFGQLREGWTRNLALLFPRAGMLAIERAAEFALIVAPLVIAAFGASAIVMTGSAAIAAIVYIAFVLRIARAHFGWRANLIAVFGLPVFAYLLARSALRYSGGRKIVWKGREYASRAN
jgi:glycosyltransferase involved in cell wall biosynthesis